MPGVLVRVDRTHPGHPVHYDNQCLDRTHPGHPKIGTTLRSCLPWAPSALYQRCQSWPPAARYHGVSLEHFVIRASECPCLPSTSSPVPLCCLRPCCTTRVHRCPTDSPQPPLGAGPGGSARSWGPCRAPALRPIQATTASWTGISCGGSRTSAGRTSSGCAGA